MATAKLTNNEKSVLVAIVANAKSVGDNGVEFILEDVAKEIKKSIGSVRGTVSSLQKKGMVRCANGESYFDGIVTEEGLHEVEENNKVNQEVNNSKNQGNMETNNFETPVMDERIVKLNELKSVKMSSLSKSKRPAAKANKAAAQYILENWDNAEMLQKYVNNPTSPVESYEAYCIADSRVKELAIEAAKIENGRKETEARLKKAASKKETKKADKTEQPKEKTAKTARKVGDVHPKHPTWIWTEYAPGKFDWRTNPKDKKQGQCTDKMKKAEPKKESKAPKMLTIDEFRAMPKNKGGKKMSNSQATSFQLIMKGYWIWNNEGHYFFKNDSGKTKACNMNSVTAMFKRYGIDYIPVGLVKEAR